jgi:hypothetical protein
MKKCFSGYLFCLLVAASCHSRETPDSKKALVVSDTAKYYPLTVFFRAQKEYVDLRDFPIYLIREKDGRKDSTGITKEAFLAISNSFSLQADRFQKNKHLYKESVFQDLSTSSYTLNYTPVQYETTEIQNIDILLAEETNLVKRVFLKRVYTSGDSSITEQYSWKADKSFQITRFIKKGEHFSSTETQYVNWNDKP